MKGELEQLKQQAASLGQQLEIANRNNEAAQKELMHVKVTGYDRLTGALGNAEHIQKEFIGYVNALGQTLGIPAEKINPELVLNTVKSLSAPGD